MPAVVYRAGQRRSGLEIVVGVDVKTLVEHTPYGISIAFFNRHEEHPLIRRRLSLDDAIVDLPMPSLLLRLFLLSFLLPALED